MDYYNPTDNQKELRRKALEAFDGENRRAMLTIYTLLDTWNPDTPIRSHIDFGCGSGAMVDISRKLGIEAVGLDVIASHPNITHDLREPFVSGRKFDIATCIEVAEHIEQEYSETLVQSIAENLATGGILVFTAAPPGQHGDHHVNCQSGFWWRQLLHKNKLHYNRQITIDLAYLWRLTTGSQMHLPANVQVFVRSE